jgi:oligopeptide/dipeptide ABC transporter ATP-binding protein
MSESAPAGAVTLELIDVSTSLLVGSRLRPVVVGVDLALRPGEIVGLVGESGSGKSMTARTIAGALPRGAVATGSVRLNGEDLLTMTRRRRRAVQPAIGMIFQDPRAYIDPLWRVETHLTEGMRVHLGLSRAQARARAIELLDTVGIDQPERRIHQYPGEMSGGMLQRVMIAGALSVEPSVLLADEATTALDVTTQAAIVRLLERIRTEQGLAVLFITHDLALANSICDRVCVMYAGRLVEVRAGSQIFDDPRHPYTMGLLAARPSVAGRLPRLPVIAGTPTSAMEAPEGCAFHPRCDFALEECRQGVPGFVTVPGGVARCLRAGERLRPLRAPLAVSAAEGSAASTGQGAPCS